MQRGRPSISRIRQNIVEILSVCRQAYGYEIYRAYKEIFTAPTMRSIYFQLKKGMETNEFIVESVRREEGEYSWGKTADKTYYRLGPCANPSGDKRVRDYFSRISLELPQEPK
jgi:hypothetical protein